MSVANNQANTNTEEISVKELILKVKNWWDFLLSKRKIVFISAIIGGSIGLTYSLISKPAYKAELTFALQNEKSNSGGLGGALSLASQFGMDVGGGVGGGEFSGENFLKLMKSRSMVEKALLTPLIINNKETTLAEFYIDFNELRKAWKNDIQIAEIHFPPNSDRSKFTLKQDSILGVLHKSLISNNLIVDKLEKNLSIISVRVNSSNELFSKYFTEILATVVSDFYIQTKTKREAQNVDILKQQTDSVRLILNSHISGAAAAVDNNPNPNPALTILKVPSQRRTIEVQINTVILSELIKNLEMAKMSLLRETPLIQVIDKPILPLEKVKVSKSKSAILGAIVAAIFTVLFLTIRKIWKDIMS